MELFIIAALLVLVAEATYLVVKLPRQSFIKKQARPILVDTSVLIDGRIVSVASTGFIGGTLLIPRSVVGELQFLADNADHEKRARARHGLDVVTELQAMQNIKVEILQDGSKAAEGVDERLLSLSKKYDAALCTIDFNLNKVAVVEGIEVLNVNQLAQTLRMSYLPGERMLLELVQKGQDSHQAVGYLPDGTMVVVEHASSSIGTAKEIEFIRSLQTTAGKMMFARLVGGNQTGPKDAPKTTLPARSKIAAVPKPDLKKQPIAQPAKPKQQQQRPNGRAPRPAQTTQNSQAQPATKAPEQRSPRRRDHEDSLLQLVEKQNKIQ